MATLNIQAAWIGILLGFLAGAIQGLFFQDENWLGGYGAWPRRMTRLAHISFFGLAFINLAYGLSVHALELQMLNPWPSRLFILGAITMPLVCYLAAYKKPFRHLFPIPVLSLAAGAIIFIYRGLL